MRMIKIVKRLEMIVVSLIQLITVIVINVYRACIVLPFGLFASPFLKDEDFIKMIKELNDMEE